MTYDFFDDDDDSDWQREDSEARTVANLITTLNVQMPASPGQDLRVALPRTALTLFATELRLRYGALPQLIIGTDSRAQHGDFLLTYLFALPRNTSFIIADVTVPAADPSFPSLAAHAPLVGRYECEIHDMLGLLPRDHPDLRRLVLPPTWPADVYPLRGDALLPTPLGVATTAIVPQVGSVPDTALVLGPLSAGVASPLRLSMAVAGETIMGLHEQLGFAHRGIERLCVGLPPERLVVLAECAVGDASVAHALACCQALEAIARVTVPPKAALIRVVLLELERLASQIGMVAQISTVAGAAVAQAHAARLREVLLRLNLRLSGHRLLRGSIVPGGVSRDLTPDATNDLRATLALCGADLADLFALIHDHGLLRDRLVACAVLSPASARAWQLGGPVARASGCDSDLRRDRPFAAYADLHLQVPVAQAGDAWARLLLTFDEMRQSLALIEQALERIRPGAFLAPLDELPAASALGLVESWRGPVFAWIAVDSAQRIARCKISDPTFALWPAFCVAVQGQSLADLPLCLRSFGLSVAGHDC